MAVIQQVTTFFLEMLNKSDFNPKSGYREAVEVRLVANAYYLNWVLFAGVGLPWKWYSRLKWSQEEWDIFLTENRVQTYLAFHKNHLIGYFELERLENNSVEIAFLGLLPEYLGKKLGGYLLSHAIETAWNLNTGRIWLHTCDNDSSTALKNYLARGLKIYSQITEEEEVPEKVDFLEYIQYFYNNYMDQYTSK